MCKNQHNNAYCILIEGVLMLSLSQAAEEKSTTMTYFK